MRRQFLVIHNPLAGLKQGPLLMRTLAELEGRGCRLEFAVARDAAEDAALARQAAERGEVEAVVAAGGDSTVRGVAMGLAGTSLPLGLLPVGTGNVLAHEIGLAREPRAIADALMAGDVRRLRMGLANGQPFLLMAGVGFDAEVVKHLDHRLKQRLLKAAYAGPSLRAVLRRQPHLRVTVDGREFAAAFMVATRVRHYGGSMLLAPAASPERADCEVVLFQGGSRLALVRQLTMLALGRIAHAAGVVRLSGREIGVVAEPAAAWQIDGEWMGETPLVIGPAEPSFDLLVPAAGAPSP